MMIMRAPRIRACYGYLISIGPCGPMVMNTLRGTEGQGSFNEKSLRPPRGALRGGGIHSFAMGVATPINSFRKRLLYGVSYKKRGLTPYIPKLGRPLNQRCNR